MPNYVVTLKWHDGEYFLKQSQQIIKKHLPSQLTQRARSELAYLWLRWNSEYSCSSLMLISQCRPAQMFAETNVVMVPHRCAYRAMRRLTKHKCVREWSSGQECKRIDYYIINTKGIFPITFERRISPTQLCSHTEAGLPLCIIHVSISSWWSCAMSVCSHSRGAGWWWI